VLAAGDTFIGFGAHLYIIAEGPDEAGEMICVNFTDATTAADSTTLCRVGEHPYLQKESVLNYEQAKRFPAARIEELIKSGDLKKHKQCSDDLLKRIRAGFVASQFAPKWARDFAKKAEW
jgi:hypothetical protein